MLTMSRLMLTMSRLMLTMSLLAHNVASCSQCRLVSSRLAKNSFSETRRDDIVSKKRFWRDETRRHCEHEFECVYTLALQIGEARFFYVSQALVTSTTVLQTISTVVVRICNAKMVIVARLDNDEP